MKVVISIQEAKPGEQVVLVDKAGQILDTLQPGRIQGKFHMSYTVDTALHSGFAVMTYEEYSRAISTGGMPPDAVRAEQVPHGAGAGAHSGQGGTNKGEIGYHAFSRDATELCSVCGEEQAHYLHGDAPQSHGDAGALEQRD